MKRMLKPMPSAESPVTSPEMGRRRYNYYNSATNTPHTHQHTIHNAHMLNNNGTISRNASQSSRFSGSRCVSFSIIKKMNYRLMLMSLPSFIDRSSHEIGRGHQHGGRGLYLELERERSCVEGSPPSDNVMFDNQCYATTPSSSNGNSDQDQPPYGRQSGRHSHHHQVGFAGPIAPQWWRGVPNPCNQICLFSSLLEPSECYSYAGFTNVAVAAGVRDASAQHAGEGHGRRVVQFAHV